MQETRSQASNRTVSPDGGGAHPALAPDHKRSFLTTTASGGRPEQAPNAVLPCVAATRLRCPHDFRAKKWPASPDVRPGGARRHHHLPRRDRRRSNGLAPEPPGEPTGQAAHQRWNLQRRRPRTRHRGIQPRPHPLQQLHRCVRVPRESRSHARTATQRALGEDAQALVRHRLTDGDRPTTSIAAHHRPARL